MRKVAAITAIVVGIIMAIAGVVTWVVVSSTLSDQNITVSDDANCAAGDKVNGPISAFCQADIIDQHTLAIDELTERIELVIEPLCRFCDLICSIPGIGTTTAEVITAETGADVSRFPTASHLASWAGRLLGTIRHSNPRPPARTRQRSARTAAEASQS